MDTCAVVVTYNRSELLKECINAINNQTEPVKHIVIVNNASTDDTRQYLDSLNDSKYIIFNSENNLGGAGGFNNGLKIAYNETQDANFWLMDDDTVVQEDCNKQLLDARRRFDVSFLISNVRWKDGSPANVMTPADDWPILIDDGLVKVNYGSFVSYSISRDLVEKNGFPIADMFIWGDDSEFSLRVSRDYPGYFVSSAKAIHKSKSNSVASGIESDSVERINRYYYLYRNSMYTKRKYGTKIEPYNEIFKALKKVVKIFIVSDKKFKRVKAVLSGIFAGVVFNPKIEMPDSNNEKET
ncbi:glycosyltransferase family 2 protein [Paucilactobacillus nenjiangensis]|jgi:GT2 family glycosyltransferase|uniref:glycosyltransferase family 2 protein n=1 Tax=Paucilactobacillus nenjiangensis TaxID=1296540 RepID=UPI0010F954E2|nr:glycosyltransferase family 2 protein [Paucilactobacillus nenjiangensis]